MRWVARTAVVVAVLAAGVAVGVAVDGRAADDPEPTTQGPVLAAPSMDSLPTAQVSGPLRLVDGCLLLGDEVVVWPAGTTWDAEHQAVGFSGSFEGAAPAPLDAWFSGGGGHYGDVDTARSVFTGAAESLSTCVEETGAEGVVFAHPDVPGAGG